MGWVLIELPMLDMRIPTATMSAFVEEPYDALNGVEPEDWLPIQGVAFDRGRDDEYVGSPAIAFPPVNGVNVGTINEEKKIFSLMVNLSEFSPGDTVRIGLYGFVHSYRVAGTLGEDDPFQGTVESSTFYGTLTHHYSDVDPITPGGLSGAAQYLRIHQMFDPFGFDRMVSSFPELAAADHEYGANGIGENFGLLWGWNLGTEEWDEETPGTISPEHDPNAFIIYTPNRPDVTTYWNTGNYKTIGSLAGTVNISLGPFPTLDNQTEVPSPPPDGYTSANIQGSAGLSYYVPTWYFNNDRPVTVSWAFSDPILWTQQALRVYPRPANSYTWETDDYPTRPDMTEIATAVIPSRDDRVPVDDPFNDYPYNHFGEPRIGTITILVGDTPGVTFVPEPAPAPADGTPDGTGPIGDGTAPGRTANPQLRAWTFSHDGHDFYVLRLGDFDQLVYDTYSEQWMDWNDFDSLTWRAHCGINWSGAEALADTYGSNIVAGDDAYGLLWFLDPEQPYDDAPGGGDPAIYFSRVTMGQVPMNGREVLPCYAAWLTADMGDPAYLGAAVTLWTSDDAGVTWDNHGYVSVTADENSPQLSWYSLGQIAAPGRLFRIFDDGAITRIDALEMNDPDDEK